MQTSATHLNPARGMVKQCNSPSELWGRAPAKFEFGAF